MLYFLRFFTSIFLENILITPYNYVYKQYFDCKPVYFCIIFIHCLIYVVKNKKLI